MGRPRPAAELIRRRTRRIVGRRCRRRRDIRVLRARRPWRRTRRAALRGGVPRAPPRTPGHLIQLRRTAGPGRVPMDDHRDPTTPTWRWDRCPAPPPSARKGGAAFIAGQAETASIQFRTWARGFTRWVRRGGSRRAERIAGRDVTRPISGRARQGRFDTWPAMVAKRESVTSRARKRSRSRRPR